MELVSYDFGEVTFRGMNHPQLFSVHTADDPVLLLELEIELTVDREADVCSLILPHLQYDCLVTRDKRPVRECERTYRSYDECLHCIIEYGTSGGQNNRWSR